MKIVRIITIISITFSQATYGIKHCTCLGSKWDAEIARKEKEKKEAELLKKQNDESHSDEEKGATEVCTFCDGNDGGACEKAVVADEREVSHSGTKTGAQESSQSRTSKEATKISQVAPISQPSVARSQNLNHTEIHAAPSHGHPSAQEKLPASQQGVVVSPSEVSAPSHARASTQVQPVHVGEPVHSVQSSSKANQEVSELHSTLVVGQQNVHGTHDENGVQEENLNDDDTNGDTKPNVLKRALAKIKNASRVITRRKRVAAVASVVTGVGVLLARAAQTSSWFTKAVAVSNNPSASMPLSPTAPEIPAGGAINDLDTKGNETLGMGSDKGGLGEVAEKVSSKQGSLQDGYHEIVDAKRSDLSATMPSTVPVTQAGDWLSQSGRASSEAPSTIPDINAVFQELESRSSGYGTTEEDVRRMEENKEGLDKGFKLFEELRETSGAPGVDNRVASLEEQLEMERQKNLKLAREKQEAEEAARIAEKTAEEERQKITALAQESSTLKRRVAADNSDRGRYLNNMAAMEDRVEDLQRKLADNSKRPQVDLSLEKSLAEERDELMRQREELKERLRVEKERERMKEEELRKRRESSRFNRGEIDFLSGKLESEMREKEKLRKQLADLLEKEADGVNTDGED